MRLKYCSLTGADDAVNPEQLIKLSISYPFTEWAILYSPAKMGQPRYPSLAWIKNLVIHNKKLSLALHLCEEGLFSFLAGSEDVVSIMQGFKRVQLNVRFGTAKERYDKKQLIDRICASPQWQFILQYGEEERDLLPLLHPLKNHAILFDVSAGRGLLPEKWPIPLTDHFCGYAGGLNPDNMEESLKNIAKVVPERTLTWVDMETGIRTNNCFDLSKAKHVLETCLTYL